jgi:hypothetical protein
MLCGGAGSMGKETRERVLYQLERFGSKTPARPKKTLVGKSQIFIAGFTHGFAS